MKPNIRPKCNKRNELITFTLAEAESGNREEKVFFSFFFNFRSLYDPT